MVRKTFGIYSEDLSDCDLFIETGREYISCWCKNHQTKLVKAFELFDFAETNINDFENLLNSIRSDSRLLTAEFEKAYCIWGHKECVCIPQEFYKDEIAVPYMEMNFGECDEAKFCKDTINDCVTLGLIPTKILAEYSKRHTISSNVHKYYQLLKGQYTDNSGNKLHLVFYHTHLIISVFKEGNLQLIQNFSYKIPADVLYYVLNIFNAYELPLNETLVHASGMIDTASPLYGTLRAYINHFFIEPADKNLFEAEIFQNYPLHYFFSFCQYDV
ncbi:MAG TPA: DUF3822 family protein [Chitinophagaceae bacterium]